MPRRFVGTFLLAVAIAASGACGPGTAPAGQPPMAVLSKNSFEGLRDAFNQTSDQTRVILLLSPTCGTCLRGASAVDAVLRRYPNAPVTVFAVWQPMLPTDLSQPTTGTLGRLSDRRVRQFYDHDHRLAGTMKADARSPQPVQECCTLNDILWDLVAIYVPGDKWTDKMPVAKFFNGPVVGVTEGLEKVLGGK